MRFPLSSSPFKNVHLFFDEDLASYLDGRLRELVWQYRNAHRNPLPPCAFLFGKETGSYVVGYEYPTPAAYLEQVKYEARSIEAIKVLLMAEVSSVAAGSSASLLVVEAQEVSCPGFRVAYDLLGPGRVPISANWTLTSVDIDGLARIVGEEELTKYLGSAEIETSTLLGLASFFCTVIGPGAGEPS